MRKMQMSLDWEGKLPHMIPAAGRHQLHIDWSVCRDSLMLASSYSTDLVALQTKSFHHTLTEVDTSLQLLPHPTK